MNLTPFIYYVLLPVLVVDALLVIRHRIKTKSAWRASWLVPGHGLYLYFKEQKDQP